MSSKVVRDLVWAKLDDVWSTTRIVDLENGRDPLGSSLDPWVSIQFIMATEDQNCLGPVGVRGWREEGEFQLIVGVPTYTGWDDCLTYIDPLRAAFRQWAPTELTIRKVHPARAMVANNQLIGNWYVATALVSYFHDFRE